MVGTMTRVSPTPSALDRRTTSAGAATMRCDHGRDGSAAGWLPTPRDDRPHSGAPAEGLVRRPFNGPHEFDGQGFGESATTDRHLGAHSGPTAGAPSGLRLAAESLPAQNVLTQIGLVAPTTTTVLLTGETGAGKEMFAEALHALSPRRQKAIVRVNCAALPATLIESELFGRERGAYTGAISRQTGRFELAHGSTIFLDEIGDLPLDVQVKLLRVLQEKTFERLGSAQPIKVDVRVVAATNRDLERAVADKTFREDLFYRLNVFPIRVPPLRERTADLPALVWAFIEEFAAAFNKPIQSVTKASLDRLRTYEWPGNIRELRNVVERAMIVATGPHLDIEVPIRRAVSRERCLKLADVEREHITSVLESTAWRVRGRAGAAQLLDIKPTTLEGRMAKLGIRRPDRFDRNAGRA